MNNIVTSFKNILDEPFITTLVLPSRTNLTFHAIDPATNEIIDYYEFLDRVEETSSIDEVFSNLAECNIVRIEVSSGN